MLPAPTHGQADQDGEDDLQAPPSLRSSWHLIAEEGELLFSFSLGM